jgi:hypothetical protein
MTLRLVQEGAKVKKDEPAIAAGPVFIAMKRWKVWCAADAIALSRASFPSSSRRVPGNSQLGLKIEAEHGFVFKENGDDINVGTDFNALDRLAFDLGKLEEPPCTFLARVCTLRSSHRSPFQRR